MDYEEDVDESEEELRDEEQGGIHSDDGLSLESGELLYDPTHSVRQMARPQSRRYPAVISDTDSDSISEDVSRAEALVRGSAMSEGSSSDGNEDIVEGYFRDGNETSTAESYAGVYRDDENVEYEDDFDVYEDEEDDDDEYDDEDDEYDDDDNDGNGYDSEESTGPPAFVPVDSSSCTDLREHIESTELPENSETASETNNLALPPNPISCLQIVRNSDLGFSSASNMSDLD